MSGSRTTVPAQAGQQDPAERELVFCHQCQNEWYRDQHGLTCPECESEFTEIVSYGRNSSYSTATQTLTVCIAQIENNRSDPREEAHGGHYISEDSDEDEEDDPTNPHQSGTGVSGFRIGFGGPGGLRFESIRGGFPGAEGDPFGDAHIRGGNDRSPIDEHGRPQPRHPNWGAGDAQSPVAEMFANIIQNIMGQPNPNVNRPGAPQSPQANRPAPGFIPDHGINPSPIPSRSNAGSPFGLFPGFPPSPGPRGQGGHSHSTTVFERRTMGPDGQWRIERSASNSPMPGFGTPLGMPGMPMPGLGAGPGQGPRPRPAPAHDNNHAMPVDEITK